MLTKFELKKNSKNIEIWNLISFHVSIFQDDIPMPFFRNVPGFI